MFNKSQKSETKIEIQKNTKQEDTIDIQKTDDEQKDEEDKKDITPKKEDEEKTSSNNKSNNTNKKTNTNNTKTESTPQNTAPVQQEQPKQQEQPVQPKQPEPAKESGPWEAWGMTKEQYYNEPLHSWERVDFKASSCGSESNCLSVCAAKGDTYDGYLYSCEIITSASGKFLGVMLDLEKLN